VRSQEALKQSHEFIPTPNIQKSCIKLNHFFRHVFDSQAEFGNSNDDPAIVYCCGATGTGKTMTVRHMVHLAKHRTIKKDAAEYDSVHYVNCSSLPMNTTSSEAYDYLLKKYEINELQFRERGRPRSLDGCTVIILDEIDHIVGQKGLEGMLQRLLDIASKNESLLAIVGISTSVYNKKSEKLLLMGMGSNKIVFPMYKKEELTELFKYTVGFDSINFKTVEFVAGKVSHSSGDACAFFTTMDRTIGTTIHCLVLHHFLVHTGLILTNHSPVFTMQCKFL
jgi:Cdc6-like AAA superfamily ATPase